jgi:hypothetical protein
MFGIQTIPTLLPQSIRNRLKYLFKHESLREKLPSHLTGRPHYNPAQCGFMAPDEDFVPQSEPGTVCPPALVIRDKENALWTLGFDQGSHWTTGEFEFDVVRNMRKTGARACRIEKLSNGYVRIFGSCDGSRQWRTWNGREFV